MVDISVEWAAFSLSLVALVISVGFRIFDYYQRPKQKRIERIRPLFISLRNIFKSASDINHLELGEWYKIIDTVFFGRIEDLYRQAIQDGLDFVLDKESKVVRAELEDFIRSLKAHRLEVASLPKDEQKKALAQAMAHDSRILYITLHIPDQIAEWLAKHS